MPDVTNVCSSMSLPGLDHFSLYRAHLYCGNTVTMAGQGERACGVNCVRARVIKPLRLQAWPRATPGWPCNYTPSR